MEKSASITIEDFVLISADDVKNWGMFSKWPLAVKILILPYFMAVLFSLFQIVNKFRQLFTNFANNIVLNKSNVHAISKLSKLFIFFSLLTINPSALLVSVVLLVLCETIKNGTILKEELDFTV